MTDSDTSFSRRDFIAASSVTAVGAAALGSAVARAAPKAAAARYRRYNVASPQGQRMLASYARGVEAMLALPPAHPHNWFRNVFVHLMDCPHGNWWFYVWHRGYVGYMEETIRKLSGDSNFAMPYWDWTQSPQIPDAMFSGALNPGAPAFAKTTENIAVFDAAMRPALDAYWKTLNPAQLGQLATRGYKSTDDVWNDVSGNGVSGNMAYANPCGARYLTRSNPKLDPKTAYDVSPFVVTSGLLPKSFWSDDIHGSFTSSRTPSHNTQPSNATKFSILEGFPHNKVHNYIGGVGPLDPGPYGNMTNFMSPVDPIFFLHHSNMDRLWDVWTRKQQRLGLPWLPSGADLAALSSEPFLFFVDGNGNYVTNGAAGQYLNTARFDYDYQPGFGDTLNVGPAATSKGEKYAGTRSGGIWSASVPAAVAAQHLASAANPLIAEVTFTRPSDPNGAREFDVLVNAPDDVTGVDADSPFFAGTVAFVGPIMTHMEHMDQGGGGGDATFAVPIPRQPALFAAVPGQASTLRIRVVPSRGGNAATPALKTVTIRRQ